MDAHETDGLLLRSQQMDDFDEQPADDHLASNMFSRMKHGVAKSWRSSRPKAALLEEYRHVKDALVDVMQETEDEADFFLSMGLTKNLSILPSKPEVVQSVEEVKDLLGSMASSLRRNLSLLPASSMRTSDHKPAQQPQQSQTVPLHAYLTLASAVCALSSIGPFLAKQQDVSANLKIVWRFQGTAILLSPLAIRSIVVDGMPKLTFFQWGTFVLAAASYSVLCVAFAMSVEYITVANATILTNSQSILLVLGKLLFGHKVVFLEGLGVLVAFAGGVLCAKESAEDEASPATGWWSIWGDVLGLISSIGGIGYIVLGKSLRSHIAVLLFMVMNMLTASFLIMFYMLLTGDKISLDRNVNHGIFGYFNLQFDRLPLELMTVIICNTMGTMGYVRAFAYFSSVVIAVAALMEPVVAAFTAVALGVGVLPGAEGWIGNFLVAAGTLAVLYPTIQPEEVIQSSPQSKIPRTPYPRLKSPRLQVPRKRQHYESIDETEPLELNGAKNNDSLSSRV